MSDLRAGFKRVHAYARRWWARGEVSPQWNYWNLYRDIAWYGVLSGISTTFTSIYCLRLGGSNFLVGLLTSLPALINVLVQIPAARLIERQRNQRTLLLVSGILMRAPMLLLALVPLLLLRWRAEAVVAVTALGTIPAAISNTAFTVMLADVVAPTDRARVVSVRNILFSAVSTLVVLAAGKALDVWPFPMSYQAIFLLAFVTSLLSVYYVGRVAIPDGSSAVETAPQLRQDWRATLRAMWQQRDYTRFTLASFLYHWGLNFPVPLYAIYRVRVLHLGEGWIGLIAMIESAVTVVTWYFWGKAAEKRGSRYVLLLGALGMCLYPLGTALSKNPWPLLFVAFVGGVVGPAYTLGEFNGLLEAAPSDRRPTYVAWFNLLINITAFISPLVSTILANQLGIVPALYLSTGLRFAGCLAYLVLLKA